MDSILNGNQVIFSSPLKGENSALLLLSLDGRGWVRVRYLKSLFNQNNKIASAKTASQRRYAFARSTLGTTIAQHSVGKQS
jgi:hypothetical protein